MIKIEELKSPISCLNRANSNEMVFVLLERDLAAPFAIYEWCRQRILLGKNKPDDAQIKEAYECANYMRKAQDEKKNATRQKQSVMYDRVNTAIAVLRKKRAHHSMSCEFPEGCSCHANHINQEIDFAISELNKLKAEV